MAIRTRLLCVLGDKQLPEHPDKLIPVAVGIKTAADVEDGFSAQVTNQFPHRLFGVKIVLVSQAFRKTSPVFSEGESFHIFLLWLAPPRASDGRAGYRFFANLRFLSTRPPRPSSKSAAGSGTCVAINSGPLNPEAKTDLFPLESNLIIVPPP